MKKTHDVYAETNPAYCASVLIEFTDAYLSARPEGPETPMAYLALPVALSGELAGAFDGTNKNTGLLEWLDRSPQVQVGLAERVNASMDIVTEAIRFGCFARILVMEESARLRLGDKKIKRSVIRALGGESAQAIKHAGRLGHWFASAGSTRTVFDMMGLTA